MEIKVSLPGRVVWGVAAAAVVLGGAWWWSTRHERAAREALAEMLYFPDAAELSGVFVGKPPSNALCGDVRAKNAFGAFLGVRAFVVVPNEFGRRPDVRVIDGDRQVDPSWRAFCE